MATNRRTAPPAPAGRGASPLHAVGGRRPGVLLGGGGAVLVVLYALYRRSSNANTSTTTGTAATPSTYDSTVTDMENQIQALQAQIASLPTTASGGGGGTSTGSTSHPVILGGSPPTTGVIVPALAVAAPLHTQAVVRVQQNNTLSGIAAKFGETWQQVFAYNLAPGVRPAATERVLATRGPNLLYPGEQIYIPTKK